MRWDRPLNRVLERLFGKTLEGERRVWLHSQNLTDEGREGKPMTWPFHGRAWLHWVRARAGGRPHKLGVSWHLWNGSCGASVSANTAEQELDFFVGLPPVSLWVSYGAPFSRTHWLWKRLEGHYGDYDFASVRVHSGSLWWRFFSPSDHWSSKTPRWRDGSFSPDKLLGGWVYETKTLEEREVLVPMPEGSYPARAILRHAVRGRRWNPFKHQQLEAEVSPRPAIPYSGKGENPWDCGKDGLWSWSGPARSLEDAVGKVVASCLSTRKKRGDPARWPEPPPSILNKGFVPSEN